MVKWQDKDEIILIPHYSDYSNYDFNQLWFSKGQLNKMIYNNYKELEQKENLLINFGKNWNIYYKHNKYNTLIKISDHNYYRYKYMNKLGFNITFKPKKDKNSNNIWNQIKNFFCV